MNDSNNKLKYIIAALVILLLVVAVGGIIMYKQMEQKIDQLSLNEQSSGDSIASADSLNEAVEAARLQQEEADRQKEENDMVLAFLKKIYTEDGLNQIFKERWIYKHCSKKMQRILRDEYQYDDGDGWGSWIIGGWGDGEDLTTKISSITADGGNIYFVTMVANDPYQPNVKGKRVIRFIINVEDGVPVIDDCKWVQDFKY